MCSKDSEMLWVFAWHLSRKEETNILPVRPARDTVEEKKRVVLVSARARTGDLVRVKHT